MLSAAPVTNVFSPTGWNYITNAFSFGTDQYTNYTWTTNDAQYRVTAGNSLSGFGFQANAASSLPETATVEALEVSPFFANYYGEVVPVPSAELIPDNGAIPEPASLLLLGMGLAPLLLCLRRR